MRKLDDEANKFYHRKHYIYEATLLSRCYTQHALRHYIDSEINHIRHFIKIPFINKGIEFIDLPSIFRDNYVISSIPLYFENTESPIICYKFNKHIRNTILNFNKLVSDLDIETSVPDFWDCKDSKFCYQPAGHSVTGKKSKRKVQGVPQSQTAALPRHQEEEETDKSKQAQIEQTYEKH